MCGGIRFFHELVTGIEPVRKPAGIHKLDAYASFIIITDMVSDPVQWDPLLNIAISFYVEVSRVAGSGIGIMNVLAIFPRGSEIRQFGAVNDNQVNGVCWPRDQAVGIG